MAIPAGVDRSVVKYFKVTWTALASTLDTADPDDTPDLETMSGTITFKPNLTQPLLFKNLDTSFTLSVMRRTISLSGGVLDEQGRPYIWLEAAVPEGNPVDWYWTATFNISFKGVPVSIEPLKFMAPPNAIIDVTNMMVADANAQYPSLPAPGQNTLVHNFGGVRGLHRLTQVEYDSIIDPPDEVVYLVHTPA